MDRDRDTILFESCAAVALPCRPGRMSAGCPHSAAVRTAALARADVALRQSLAAFAAGLDLEAFLGAVLSTAVGEFGATEGEVWLYDAANEVGRLVIAHDGVRVVPAEARDPPGQITHPITPLEISRQQMAAQVEGGLPHAPVEPERADESFGPRVAEHVRARGMRSVVTEALSVGGRYLGALTVRFPEERRLSAEEEELARALAAQAALAVHTSRLADAAREVARGEARAAAAEARARELARIHVATREMTGAIESGQSLEAIVPSLLQIIARTIDADAAGYFEHDDDGRISLTYFLANDRVLTPAELLGDELLGNHGAPARFANGFSVSSAYLGSAVTGRSRAGFLDHGVGTSEPEFDDWTVRNGWPLELNVPLCVAGRAVGTLTLYRGPDRRFSTDEMDLAESLAQQLALATELIRQAEREACVREREAAARARADKLAAANQALQRSVERLVSAGDLAAAMDVFLLEAVALCGAASGAIIEHIEGTRFDMRALVDEGVLVRTVDHHADSSELKAATAADACGVMARTLTGEPHRVDLDELADWFPKAAAYHKGQGHRSLWHIPYRFGQRVVGYLGLAFRDDRELDSDLLETVQALANQSWLALESQKMAEQARDAAVARELQAAAEARAAELRVANDALRRAVDGLGKTRSLHDFLAEMLRASLEVVGAINGAVALVRGETEFEHYVLMEGGRLVPREELEAQGAWRCPLHPDLLADLHRTQREGVVSNTPPEAAVHTAGMPDYHRRVGNRAIRLVPMFIGEKVIGWLGLGFDHPEPPVEHRTGLLLVLARQMTAAVEMERLGEAAREAAVAREREQAARERAAGLARANAALSRSLDRLTAAAGLTPFLEGVLREALAASGAVTGAVFVHKPAEGVLRMVALILRGEVLDPARDPRAAVFAQNPAGPEWDIMGGQQEVFWVDYANQRPDDWPHAKAFHDEHGHRFVVSVPMVLAGRSVGFLGLAFDKAEAVQPTEHRLELCRALAQQATLALHLTQLAEEARQAAVSREREVAAQAQTAELARANEFLTRSAARLAHEMDTAKILAAFLDEAVAVSGSVGGALVERIPGAPTAHAITLFHEDGRLHRGSPAARAIQEAVRRVSETDPFGFFAARAAGQPSWHRVTAAAKRLPEARAYHEARGRRALWDVPFHVGGEVRGYVSLAFDHEEPPPEHVAETVRALANQVSVALRLVQLADEARERAVAQARLAELGQANATLRASLDALSEDNELEPFLAYVLRAARALAGSSSTVLWLNEATRDQAWVHLVLEGERLASGAQAGHPFATPAPFRTALPDIAALAAERRARVITLPDAANVSAALAETLAAEGVRAGVLVPMMMGPELLGVLALRYGDPAAAQALSPERLEFIQALAHQAALAVYMDRLHQAASSLMLREERQRVARELHDTVQSQFYSAGLQLELARIALGALKAADGPDLAQLETHLGLARRLVHEGAADARRIAHAISPDAEISADLLSQVRAYLDTTFSGAGLAVTLQVEGEPFMLAPELGEQLFIIAREAVTNALKYAQASAIGLTIQYEPQEVILSIWDNGAGFEVADGGSGIRNMYSRAERVGGALVVASAPGQGTRVTVTAPAARFAGRDGARAADRAH